MTDEDYFALRARVEAGEDVTASLSKLRTSARESLLDGDEVFPWSECFALAFRYRGSFPPLDAAKALVDVALAADETMPIVWPYDAEMKNALSSTERAEVFAYVAGRIGDNRSPQSYSAAADLADYLIDIGEASVH